MLHRAGCPLQGALGHGARVSRRLCLRTIRLQIRARCRPRCADRPLPANITLSISGHAQDTAPNCTVFVGAVPQLIRGGIIAPRVRQRASLARRRAHHWPARALCPTLHDHLSIHLSSSHRVHSHLLFQLGHNGSSISAAFLQPSTPDTHTLPILQPPPISMLFLRACDMSHSHGHFRWCRDGARGRQTSGNMARCACISVFSGKQGTTEYSHDSTSTGRVPGAHRACWALCSVQHGEAV